MKEKDLEHIFKRELQDFEANPPEHLWDNISKEIAPKKTSKKVIPLWYIGSGIAASLLLLFGFMFNSSNNDTNNIKDIVTTDNTIEYCPEEVLVDNSSSIENNYEENTTNESSITLTEEAINSTNTLTNDYKENSVVESSVINSPKERSFTTKSNFTESDPNQQKTSAKETYATTFSETEQNIIENNSTRKQKETNNIPSESKYIINQNTPSKNSDLAFSKHKTNKDAPVEVEKESTFNSGSLKNISPEEDLDNINELSDTELAALLLNKKDNLDQETKEENTKKWSIQPQVGSYGYASLTGGSTIDSDFNNNPQFTETGLNYGVRIAYQATPKIKIRTGVTFTRINITTQNIGFDDSQPISELFLDRFVNLDNSGRSFEFSEALSDEAFDGIDFPTPTEADSPIEEPSTQDDDIEAEGFNDNFVDFEPTEIEEEETPVPVIEDEQAVFDPLSPTEEETNIEQGNFIQNLEYLEFPIEISFNLIDKKIGLDIIGGFSTFVLTNNEFTFESIDTNSRTSSPVGTQSLNTTSFSSNVGFAIDYDIAKNLSFNLEPIIKFQFNSFDNTTDYNPILFGLSSGVIWKF